MSTVTERITSMYENRGYLAMYGIDVFYTSVILGITLGVVSYSSYKSVLAQLRVNWNAHKCNPIVMPFAGLIMPKPNQSTSETTYENFNYCIQQDISAVFSIVMMPFEFILYITIAFMDTVLEGILAIINLIAWIKAQLGGIFAQIYNKILSFLIPIMEMIIHLRDALSKINGVLITALYTAMNIYNITVSGVINIMNILVNMITILIAVLLSMIIFAFMLIPTPAFLIGTSVYITATIAIMSVVLPTVTICILMHNMVTDLFNESSSNAPSAPKVKKRK
jgi:hypothetical protein